jgi:hypothetical protein
MFGGLIGFLYVMFAIDNLTDAISKSSLTTLYYLTPTIWLFGLAAFHEQTVASFAQCACITWLFYCYVYSISILKLMLANMTGKPKLSVF